MPVEPCQHGKEKWSDIVVTVTASANHPVKVECERRGLQTLFRKNKLKADVTPGENPRRGILQVRVCIKTERITRETEKQIEALLRGQGQQVLRN